ncbi:Peptidase C12, ubiquitin carboxyl-terminal hydrolase 1 [Penicillium expansum]|uniref:Ubiquitin carboxyl-terminal hydrolase n=1 Tax=Penicillium expansum TaxID=27334 RepID=A0A0A2JQ14_PENEN|nr:Peptidase C12, ubiquitin carboxyl-terminal hydrolase 1 [Penicillium expansum]KGO37344.1 Peptidase C12, ubiquitin carboxyl-terminal hydrolase 1 [Penicillium expansum]KGO57489.1 Peptidase C12, ubiquitin carboxyl-terminal hydrolase 1 [Penicillium expansum]KGO65195.1 Peptidase C12, ubiquitin carboxyl-terminal hydrolase 1 [Penicillium expansum]
MVSRVKRRRLTDPEDLNDICQPASRLEKDSWNGFCEIESEPALFNVMLREFGVKGVKIQEVVSLDEEMMAFLNNPVYGLIFLFRWREDNDGKQEATCPDGLWFANQTANNACASVALLNIVNNIPDIDLGENLQSFKEFTMPFTPALRGDAINNFEFVKRIHNSYARKMDILNSDLQLKTEATTRKKGPKDQAVEESDATFHFIAFMPVMGQLWKFDGLERQPRALGECSDYDWLELVKPNLLDRMAAYEEEEIEFSILGLVRDPLPDLINDLAVNVRKLEILNQRSTSLCPSSETLALDETVLGPDPSLSLTREEIDTAVIPQETLDDYQTCSDEKVQEYQQRISKSQREIRTRIREEQQSHRSDDEYAAGRRFDYGPAVRTWLRRLAQKQQLQELSALVAY